MTKLKINEKVAKEVEVNGKIYTVYRIVYESNPKWIKGYSVSEYGGWATKGATINDNCYIGDNVYIIGDECSIWASHIEGAENGDNSLYIINSRIENCAFDLQGVIKDSTLMFLNNSANVLTYNGIFIGSNVDIEKSLIKHTEMLVDNIKIKNSDIQFCKFFWESDEVDGIKNISINKSSLNMCEIRVDDVMVSNSKIVGRYLKGKIKGAEVNYLEDM